MEHSMYNTLLGLPLFQGMSRAELSEVIERAKFHFLKVEDKNPIFTQGEPCSQLVFLLSGELEAETTAPCGTFSFVELHGTPMIIEPQSLFGHHPCYKATYRAHHTASLLTIDKQYFYSVLDSYEVFRMNFFNQLCYKTEQLHERLWSINPQQIEGKLVYFIRNLCTTLQGTKILRVKMEDLAQLLDTTRLNVSAVLNKWRAEGLIEMRRKEFIIHDTNVLLQKYVLHT